MVQDWRTFHFEKLFDMCGFVPMGKSKRKGDKRYTMNVYSAFDIETSTIWLDDNPKNYNVHSFMYSWAVQIEDYTFTGRYWNEFFDFLKRVQIALEYMGEEYFCETTPKLVFWVHNLQYEFAFLAGLYDFSDEEIFFRDVRKPIYLTMFKVFEFRCSYIQTNLSLAVLCQQMGVPEKLSGQMFDYSKIRFPWTELSEFEQEYIIRDVESLVKAMRKRIEQNGDNLVTVPLTSTGYVRRDCKESLKPYYYDVRDMKPDERQYKLLRKAFRGGNTHCNKDLTGRILDNVLSIDIVSDYPTQQLTQKFPMKPFKWLDGNTSLERVFKFIGLNYAVVGLYQFKGLRMKDKHTAVPYISLSRTDTLMYKTETYTDAKGRERVRKRSCVKLDNGRILESYFSEMALTEIDLQIIMDQYYFDSVTVVECMVARKDYLPEEYRKVIKGYYDNKTLLKGDETEQGKYLYTKSKNMLNSVYGMTATDPIHQEILYKGGSYSRSNYDTMTAEEKTKALNNAPFPYQWGVYTTSLARMQLHQAMRFIEKAGKINPNIKIVYCDTDSLKITGNVDIDKLNEPYLKRAVNCGAYADDKNGHRHYLGVFEIDGRYPRFISQGAKRYAYEKEDGKMGVTVSGVTKKKNEKTGVSFAVEELGSLERFKVGMVWERAGGTMAVYNDKDDFDYTDPETGRTVHISKNVSIVPSTYTMTYSRDYKALLNEIQLYGEYRSERE